MGQTNELGDLIRLARERSGLSQAAAAEQAGIGQASLNQAEAGKRGLADTAIVKLCRALRLNVERALLAAARDRIGSESPQLLEDVGTESPALLHRTLYEAQAGHSDFWLDKIALSAYYDPAGKLHWSRTLTGLRPNPDGRTVHSVLFRDPVPAVSVGANSWQIPPIEYTVSRRTAGPWLEHELIFPKGWRNDGLGASVSGTVAVEFPSLPPSLPAGKRSALGFRPTHHVGELDIAVRSSCSWRPPAPESWAWRGEHGVEWALLNLITRETCADHAIAPTEDGVKLTVYQPLAHFTFAILWPVDGHHHAGGACTLGGKGCVSS